MAPAKIFSESAVLVALTAEPLGLSLLGVASAVGCKRQATAKKLLDALISSGAVFRRNLGCDRKPVFVYYRRL